MTDAEVLHQFLAREQRWLQTLQALRSFHEAQMGKVMTGIQWIAGRELGRFSWLGYYWHQEMFWFGYGMREGLWRPLIEVDNRSRFSDVLESMRTELSGRWESVTAEGNLYRRLWSEPSVAGESASELEWFKARSRELHEFVVQPGSA
ncbi:MAG TPA: hypothetical protein VNR00_07235 [Opitutus sp.]|nr:hypothetical protein [Opitutus sp.]